MPRKQRPNEVEQIPTGPVVEAFRQHRVHDVLRQIQNALANLSSPDLESLVNDDSAYFDAVSAIIAHAGTELQAQDPRLVTPTMLDRIAGALDPFLIHIHGCSDDPPSSTIRTAYESAVTVQDQMIGLPMSIGVEASSFSAALRRELRRAGATQLTSVSAAAASAERSAADAYETIANSSTTALGKIEAATATASAEIAAARVELAEAVSLLQTGTNRFEAQRGSVITQINEAVGGIEGRFDTAEQRRVEVFEKEQSRRREEFTDFQSASRLELADTQSKLAGTQKDADDVLKLAGAAALSGRWIKQARSQRIERFIWLGVLAVTVIISMFVCYYDLDQLTAPPTSTLSDALIFYVPRVPMAIISITAIGFMAQQIGRRALWEARDRRVANELTAFPALMSGLDTVQTDKFLTIIIEKYFPGPAVTHDEPQSEPKTPASSMSGGFYTAIASISTAALVLGAAIIVVLAK